MAITISGTHRNDTGPTTIIYSSWPSGSYGSSLYNAVYAELQNQSVGIYEFSGVQKTESKGSLSSSYYMSGGLGYNQMTGDQYFIAVQSNANGDLLGIELKTDDDLEPEGYDTYGLFEAFQYYDDYMTDAKWDFVEGLFSPYDNFSVTTQGTDTYITYKSKTVIKRSNGNYIMNNVSYDQYYGGTNQTIQNIILSDIRLTTPGNYELQKTDTIFTALNSLIDAVSSLNVSNAFTHNTTTGEISVLNIDGTTPYILSDKNVGASSVYNEGDTKTETNCGNYFQRGNNYGFPFSGNVTTSTTQVDASSYGPGTENGYYSSSTYITDPRYSSGRHDWSNPSNNNLWGNTVNTDYARQGPCDYGYHVPSKSELSGLFTVIENIITALSLSYSIKNILITYLHMPLIGNRGNYGSGSVTESDRGMYYSSSPCTESNVCPCYIWIGYDAMIADDTNRAKGYGMPIRPFKNSYTLTPINQIWTGSTSAAENLMNQHPYDYYLLGGCESVLRLLSDGTMHNVYASYDSNTNTRSVSEVW